MDKPKRMIVAPSIPAEEMMRLRAHIDEAITDPDYSVVVSYECRWDEVEKTTYEFFGFQALN